MYAADVDRRRPTRSTSNTAANTIALWSTAEHRWPSRFEPAWFATDPTAQRRRHARRRRRSTVGVGMHAAKTLDVVRRGHHDPSGPPSTAGQHASSPPGLLLIQPLSAVVMYTANTIDVEHRGQHDRRRTPPSTAGHHDPSGPPSTAGHHASSPPGLLPIQPLSAVVMYAANTIDGRQHDRRRTPPSTAGQHDRFEVTRWPPGLLPIQPLSAVVMYAANMIDVEHRRAPLAITIRADRRAPLANTLRARLVCY